MEKVAALGKRLKCLREEIVSTDAKFAAWADETTSLVEDLEYWESKMASLMEGQENIRHESVTIELLQGLIASTMEKVAAQWGIEASLKEKKASLRKTQDELDREITRPGAKLDALEVFKKQIYQLVEKLIKALSPKPGDAQEPSATGHD